MSILHLDYETFSECDITKAGAHAYAAHPSTEVLMLGWSLDGAPVEVWEPHKGPMPDVLANAFNDPDTLLYAFNAQFERLITRDVMGINIPPHRWRCVMVMSYYLGFSGGLDAVCEQVGIRGKDPRGARLINLFSKPAPKNHKASRYTWENRPEDWRDFVGYCRQDVEAEMGLHAFCKRFPLMAPWDWEQWFIDQEINDRGVPLDTDMARSAVELWSREQERLKSDLAQLTGLSRVTRGPFKEWLEGCLGRELPNLRKDTLQHMEGLDPFSEAAEAIDLWLQKEAKATAKYTAMLNGVQDDGRVRGMFQYKGASRTDRVGGRRVQMQNLKRPMVETPEAANTVAEAIRLCSPDMLRILYDKPVAEVLGSAVRHAICAPEGRLLIAADFSSIESVVLGWLAQCSTIDEIFRSGRDSYKVFAAEYYGVPYEQVTKAQRKFSKPPVLGAGYFLGWRGLIRYAESMGVKMTEEQAKRAIDTFRGMYPEIVEFWDWIDTAVRHVTATGEVVTGYRLQVARDDRFLRVQVPSGRWLSYYLPSVETHAAPWAEYVMTEAATHTREEYRDSGWTDAQLVQAGLMVPPDTVTNFSYMGMNDRNQWVRIHAHKGGLTENLVQSIAGDLLWDGIRGAEAAGLPVILHVHDEIVCEVPEETAEQDLETLKRVMTTQPGWCRDMWLGASGFITKRYMKD